MPAAAVPAVRASEPENLPNSNTDAARKIDTEVNFLLELKSRLQEHAAASAGKEKTTIMRSARAAAADKEKANESRAVEHIAELEDMDDGAPQWVPTTSRKKKKQKAREWEGVFPE